MAFAAPVEASVDATRPERLKARPRPPRGRAFSLETRGRPMPAFDETHFPDLRSWVASAEGHPDFPIQNLPFGVFSPMGAASRGGVAIGNKMLDLKAVSLSGLVQGEAQAACAAAAASTLNEFLGLPSSQRRALRRALSALLASGLAR